MGDIAPALYAFLWCFIVVHVTRRMAGDHIGLNGYLV